MRLLILSNLFLVLLIGCQSYNSNTFDFLERPSIDPSTPLYDAYNVIYDDCIDCHSGYHNNWLDPSIGTNEGWINAGLVISSDPTNSILIQKLKNVGGNMPLNEPQIDNVDYQDLIVWINSL